MNVFSVYVAKIVITSTFPLQYDVIPAGALDLIQGLRRVNSGAQIQT